jgi:hypothetical protein
MKKTQKTSLSHYGVPEGQIKRARRLSPAPPYTHLLRRSGRSPALPYPPNRRTNFNMKINMPNVLNITFFSAAKFDEFTNILGRKEKRSRRKQPPHLMDITQDTFWSLKCCHDGRPLLHRP